ncbi:hypothetical protein E2320_001274 [Naja naja]|nr:hypothetical protein E2320_001274 [Naja naja]
MQQQQQPDPPSARLRPTRGVGGSWARLSTEMAHPHPSLLPPDRAYANRPGPASQAAAAALGTRRCQRLEFARAAFMKRSSGGGPFSL